MCMPTVINWTSTAKTRLDVYMCNWKCITLKVYLQTKDKKATNYALIDSGATENFMNHHYTKYLHMPIKRMLKPQMVYNIDGMPNKSGGIAHYIDLNV